MKAIKNIVRRFKRQSPPDIAAGLELLKTTKLFDPSWYTRENPDVIEAGADPFVHFLEHGGLEGRRPSEHFDSAWYLETNPDVADAKINPLIHFLTSGHNEGRLPLRPELLAEIEDKTVYSGLHIDFGALKIAEEDRLVELVENSGLFDRQWYLETYTDVKSADVDPLRHFLTSGVTEGRSPGPNFDSNWYISAYPDVAEASVNPLVHYLTQGLAEGRSPQRPQKPEEANVELGASKDKTLQSSDQDEAIQLIRDSGLFDSKWYQSTYPDIAGAYADPLLHFINVGHTERRSPGPGFDTIWYLTEYTDVAEAEVNPLLHYITRGKSEGRLPTPPGKSNWVKPFGTASVEDAMSLDVRLVAESEFFDSDWYLRAYPAVAREGIDPAHHYTSTGGFEGNNPSPRFDSDYYLETVARPKWGGYDLRKMRVNPLVHFLREGRHRGLRPLAALAFDSAADVPNGRIPASPSLPNYERLDGFKALFLGDLQIGQIPTPERVEPLPIAERTLAAFCQLNGSSLTLVHAGSEGVGQPQKKVTTQKHSGASVLNLTPLLGQFSDIWIDGRSLNIRIDLDGNKRPDLFPHIDVYQMDGPGSSSPKWIGGRLVGEDTICLIQAPLVNAYSPVLIAVTDAVGRVLSLGLLPYPSLCRGGAHYGELLYFGAGANPVSQLRSYSDHLMREQLGSGKPGVGTLTVSCEGPLGRERLFSPEFLVWLERVHGLRPNFVTQESADRAATNRIEALVAETSATKTRKSLGSRGSAQLTVSQNDLPTLAILVARNLRLKADKPSQPGAFIVCDEFSGHPTLSVTLAANDTVVAGNNIPYLTHETDIEPTDTAEAFPLPPLALLFRSTAFSPSKNDPTRGKRTARGGIAVKIVYRSGDDLVSVADALRRQSVSRDIVSVDFRHIGTGDSPPLSEIENVLSDFPYRDGKAQFVFVCDASVILTAEETLGTLRQLCSTDRVASSSCAIEGITQLNSGTRRLVSGGFFPSQISVSGLPGLRFRTFNRLEALPSMTFRVVANSFKLAMVRSEIWSRFDGDSALARFAEGGDLEFCLHAVKAGHSHICTSSIRAHSVAELRLLETVDPVAESFLPLPKWQEILETCTIIRELS